MERGRLFHDDPEAILSPVCVQVSQSVPATIAGHRLALGALQIDPEVQTVGRIAESRYDGAHGFVEQHGDEATMPTASSSTEVTSTTSSCEYCVKLQADSKDGLSLSMLNRTEMGAATISDRMSFRASS